VLSTRAHNTVRVDGWDQNRRTRRETHVVREPGKSNWRSDENFDYAEGTYDFGYGLSNAVRVAHTRRVLFAKPDYWILADHLAPQDGARHHYEAMFHLDQATATIGNGSAVSVESEHGKFTILPLPHEGLSVSIVQGQKQPEVQGWLPTGEHNKLCPIPTAVYRWESDRASTAVFLLLPQRPQSAAPGLKQKADRTFELSLPGVGTDRIAVLPSGGVTLERALTNGQVATFRVQ
jgi:hypothetical protein